MEPEQQAPGKFCATPEKYHNRLIHEKSPYLLQHADNPVDWYPWGTEAFARAAGENKPVFLSIGYATCHWCHVMAHESFEDSGVAALLNKDFICIKVDREERPDIDSVYMSVCQMMTGQGGWPLTVFLTPEKMPFFAGTYIPRESRFGMTGLTDLLPRIARSWHERNRDIVTSAKEIAAALHQEQELPQDEISDSSLLRQGYEELVLQFDAEFGGFGRAPKFPVPHKLLFLLRYWKRTGTARALTMAEKTLGAMRRGGIFDQVGGGFHRYSTDAQWKVPHFEKMLYDQALLVMAYTEAYQATGNPEFGKTADEIISFVFRDLTSPKGAFFSAVDADSPGGEGAYYLWTAQEIETILGNNDAMAAARVFGVTQEGNYQDTKNGREQNILFRTKSIADLALASGISITELEFRIESARTRLFTARMQRPHPSVDDKILTDWNGLFIAALAQAARIFGNQNYLAAARRAMEFFQTRMRTEDGGLLHRYRDGEPAISAFGDDYAFIIRALIELYETTFEPEYLQHAQELNTIFLAHFWDESRGGFFTSADTAEILLVRKKEIYDGAIPSCNSVAFENLLRLSRLTGEGSGEQRASDLLRSFAATVHQSPAAHAWFLCALDSAAGPVQDVVIVGKRDADDTLAMIQGLSKYYLPGVLTVYKPQGEDNLLLTSIAPFIRDLDAVGGKATAYICTGHTCAVPVTNLHQLLKLLGCIKTEKE